MWEWDQGQRPFTSSRRVQDYFQWPSVLGESKVFKGSKFLKVVIIIICNWLEFLKLCGNIDTIKILSTLLLSPSG